MKKTFILLMLFGAFSASAQQKITFSCDEVDMAKKPLPMRSYEMAITDYAQSTIEAYLPEKRKQKLVEARFHPFMFALQLAYDDHRPIVISPDMIWLLVSQGLANHIDQNSGELKQMFVQHQGKQQLSIDTRLYGKFKKGDSNSPWQKLTPVFADSIKAHVGKEFYTTMVQEFSTTTPEITTAYEITLMRSMDNYFEYEARTLCGIPEITIEGTPTDWKKISETIKSIEKYKTREWVSKLVPILKQFENASKGKIDKEFWQNIYKVRGGSGGPYITGWIIKFFPYIGEQVLRKNPYIAKEPEGIFAGLTSTVLPSGIAQTPFKWKYYDQTFDMQFAAGFIGIRQDVITLALRPEIGWFVKEASGKVSGQ